MSRADRLVARRQEAPRPIRKSQRLRAVRDAATGKIEHKRVPHHVQGDQWWRLNLADLVERRTVTAKPHGHSVTTYSPRPKRERPTPAPTMTPTMTTPPPMAPRPAGMTRQVHRSLYRKACKVAGVPWRAASPPSKGS